MRTDKPLLISVAEASFQLSLPTTEINGLICEGDLTAVNVRGQVLVLYDSLISFARRLKQSSTVRNIGESAAEEKIAVTAT